MSEETIQANPTIQPVTIKFDVDTKLGGEMECWTTLPFLYCPSCGNRNVWYASGDGGDYYVEEQHMCSICGASWFLPDGITPLKDGSNQNRQRFEMIAKGA